MKEKVKKYLLIKWWIPLILFILAALIFLTLISSTNDLLLNVSDYFILTSIVILLIAGIWQLIKGKWYWGIIQLGSLFAGIAGLIFVTAFMSMFGPDTDTFADDLTIPENIEVFEVTPWKNNQIHNQDSYQDYILSNLSEDSSDASLVQANLFSLDSLIKKSPDVFQRYLASSPAWFVFEKQGEKFATRRWNINNNWRYELHGYYSSYSFKNSLPYFQNRFTIGLNGTTWAKNLSGATKLNLGEHTNLILSKGNGQIESHSVINVNKVAIEIFDQSPNKNRALTQSALDYTNLEFNNLLKIENFNSINKTFLSKDSSEFGKDIFELHNGGQGGIYDSELWINPGESGKIYLKAIEVSKNIQLSESRLKERSNEWIGWSNNPNEMFYSSTHFTIYEGDWNKHYAARFEVWFVPDNGKVERKLTEKIFKVEGWMR